MYVEWDLVLRSFIHMFYANSFAENGIKQPNTCSFVQISVELEWTLQQVISNMKSFSWYYEYDVCA